MKTINIDCRLLNKSSTCVNLIEYFKWFWFSLQQNLCQIQPKRCIASKQNPVEFRISDSILCFSVNISIWKYFMVGSNLVKY